MRISSKTPGDVSDSLRRRTLRGVVWSFAERFSSQAIGFVVILIMARLLTPADYGLVGMLTIFIEIGGALADSGFSSALIRQRDKTRSNTSTAFYFNLLTACALYLLLWVLAPHIARYYGEPTLLPLTRVIGLLIPINALSLVQRALLTSRLDFRRQTRVAIAAYSLSGIAGIYLAWSGLGVWAIVCYQLLSQGLYTLLLWMLGRWWPSLTFCWRDMKSMFGFGSRLTLAGMMDIAYRNAYLLVIGKAYSASALGYFTRAQQIGGFLSSNISNVVQRAAYPSLCRYRESSGECGRQFLGMLSMSCFVVFPLMWALIALPGPTVMLLLGEKWMYAATLLPPLALAFMWHPVQSLNLQVLQVFGRSDLFLRVEILKKIVGVSILFLTVSWGLEAMCWGLVGSNGFALVCNSWYVKTLAGVGIPKQLQAVGPSFIAGGVAAGLAAIVSSAVSEVSPGAWWPMPAGLAAGAAAYFGWALISRRPELRTLRTLTTHL